MTDPQLENHLTGLELQIVELVERRERAQVQGRTDLVRSLQGEIDDLQQELALTADHLAQTA